uniref:FTH domain-containing protein n=1 Tax=Steinernema glaseri TaxID=37863 RepID=A0A1I7YQ30_9BILA
MDSVPSLFVESVCLCLERWSIRRNCRISSIWGEVSSSTFKKIHTLQVFVREQEGKFYAAAQPIVSWNYDKAVPVDSVNLKFITNFRIETETLTDHNNNWKEISVDKLRRLCEFIKPMTEGTPPVHYDNEYCNKINIGMTSWITRKLLSLRLHVDCVDLWVLREEFLSDAEEFLQNAGPLYDITIYCRPFVLKHSTVDALIDKFVPVDGSRFTLFGKNCVTKGQLERLVLKCEMSNKKVTIEILSESFTDSPKMTDFFDFAQKIQEKQVIATEEKTKLELRVEYLLPGSLVWEWDVPSRK